MVDAVWTPGRFAAQVIDPALAALGLDPPARLAGVRQLLLGTALQESGLRYLRQLAHRDGRRGPVLGYFQMEPATHDDIWATYLAFRPALSALVLAIAGDGDGKPKAALMAENHVYAAAMARLRFRRAPGALPAAGDVAAMGAYWKAHYNTVQGRGRASEFEAKLAAALPELHPAVPLSAG
ncbi:hypothetical protein HB662_16745 [Roseomonas frigidaquae]|uniref:Transglycosylase SLT domain-containing protein n=1 Tax=Falsiroseomonas frigidaquae TaxID=487318 RepID=A0ABX1F279_9PROT|nr:hypothetical protein [Falsiroseomonas frigidaquae]NKE46433.1 hypothetical protein [Falsiroseomonas frigidaquae]